MMNEFENPPDIGGELPPIGQFNAEPQLGGFPPQAPEPPIFSAPQPVLPQSYAPPPQKQRRVGTFTLGLTLILLGILIPCALFIGPQAWNMLRFAPAILVFLGVETLIYAFRYKSEKLRYDGLSVFLVIAITIVTLGGAAIVPPVVNAAEYSQQLRLERRNIENTGRAAINSLGYAGYVYTLYNTNGYDWIVLWGGDSDAEVREITLRFELDDIGIAEPTKQQVAEAYSKLIAAVQPGDGLWEVSLSLQAKRPAEEGGGRAEYDALFYKGELQDITPELVIRRMNVSVEQDEYGYDDEFNDYDEYEDLPGYEGYEAVPE